MRRLSLAVVAICVVVAAAPVPTAAANPVCSAAGWISGVAGKACTVVTNAPGVIKAGKKVLSGHPLGAVKTLLGGGASGPSAGGSGGSSASTAIGLAAIGVWVLGGARFALHETATVLSETSTPQLTSTWFSSDYWRIASIAAVLTLPFLFAAAVQALMRSDLALLIRAAFGYLPLAMLAVSIAAPLTMLLLAASDELSAIVSSAAGDAGAHFLGRAALAVAGLTVLTGSPFIAFLVGLFITAGALVLWLELLMREAAVYVIVLMLPLVFAAFVWPARRVWAIRAVETLVALILSKFAIVAVLALGGAALSHSVGHSVTGFLGGIVLLIMGVFAPWAMLRLVPLTELASGAAGALRHEARAMRTPAMIADAGAGWAHDRLGDEWAGNLTAGMRRQADEAAAGTPEAEPVARKAGRVAEPVSVGAAGSSGGAAGSNGGAAGSNGGAAGSNGGAGAEAPADGAALSGEGVSFASADGAASSNGAVGATGGAGDGAASADASSNGAVGATGGAGDGPASADASSNGGGGGVAGAGDDAGDAGDAASPNGYGSWSAIDPTSDAQQSVASRDPGTSPPDNDRFGSVLTLGPDADWAQKRPPERTGEPEDPGGGEYDPLPHDQEPGLPHDQEPGDGRL